MALPLQYNLRNLTVRRTANIMAALGIALQLDLAPSPVHTPRKRAYAKLAEAGLPGGRPALMRLAARP